MDIFQNKKCVKVLTTARNLSNYFVIISLITGLNKKKNTDERL